MHLLVIVQPKLEQRQINLAQVALHGGHLAHLDGASDCLVSEYVGCKDALQAKSLLCECTS